MEQGRRGRRRPCNVEDWSGGIDADRVIPGGGQGGKEQAAATAQLDNRAVPDAGLAPRRRGSKSRMDRELRGSSKQTDPEFGSSLEASGASVDASSELLDGEVGRRMHPLSGPAEARACLSPPVVTL